MIGDPLSYNGLRMDIYQLSKRTGVHFSTHQARRFFSRWMKENGVKIEDIAVLMGHSSVEVIRKYMQLDTTDVITSLRGRAPDFDISGSDKGD